MKTDEIPYVEMDEADLVEKAVLDRGRDVVRVDTAAYLHHFGLTFGAFDFSVDRAGRWWMLECNPAGQWGWIVEETGLPIAGALAEALVAE